MTAPVFLAEMRRLLAEVEAGRSELGEAEATVPVEEYIDPERFRRECETVFRKAPLLVGPEGLLPEPGDCLALDLMGLPVVLTRDEGGTAHAFLNVCRHRNTVVLTEQGVCRKRALMCRYHNWVYGLDGALKAVPLGEAFPTLDRAKHGLVELPLVARYGVLWLLGTPGAALDLDDHLGDLRADFEAFGLEGHRVFRHVTSLKKCNWKLISDAFLEAYHVQRLHKDTLSDFFTDCQTVTSRDRGHVRSVIARHATSELKALPEEQWQVGHHATFAYYLFPNTVMITQPDHFTILSLLPKSVEETVVHHFMLVPEAPRSREAREHLERAFEFMEQGVLQREDLAIAEEAQIALHSGANSHMTLGLYEHAVAYFHDHLNEYLDQPGNISR